MINVGVIGYGYWGPNIARNFANSLEAKLTGVSDLDPEAAAKAAHAFPSARVTSDPDDILKDPKTDAVAVVTPVSTHFDLAMRALKAGKHVLVTKPLVAEPDQARRLIDEAAARKKVLMVDHTFIYTGAVRKIRELISKGDVGDVLYYDSVRVNLGLFQHDVNVIWDLAVHDLSIMDHVLAARPCAVSATGISHVGDGPENTAYLTLFFEDKLIGHIHANWLSPVKVRRTLIGGSRKMVVYDDLEPSEKVKIYDKGITVAEDAASIYKMLIGYRAGDMWAPHIDITEALAVEAGHFIECVNKGARPITDGEAGLRTVTLLEAATRSLKERGRPVELPKDYAKA